MTTKMSRTSASRDTWHPQTREEREAVLETLRDVLASPHFCNSKRYPALLQYIVEKTLAGEAESLKERTLGVEVFERPSSYDTNADTVVRYTAGEVRKRLSLYYHELGGKPAIQISLPAGSYVPEFHPLHGELESPIAPPVSGPVRSPDSTVLNRLLEPISAWPPTQSLSAPDHRSDLTQPLPHRRTFQLGWLVFAVALTAMGAVGWRYRADHPKTPLDSFWNPVLRDQAIIPVCIGGSVFSQTHTSGVATATKDVDYPFISIQSASAAAQISGLLERSGGATTQLQSAATTPLTELREHPVILLGGYNNQWTLRLLQPLRFHFAPATDGESIVDDQHPGTHWLRDPSLPYSSADDYAIVARFHDATTDSWVVALAGVGRNGTEAAAQFATSPHYMQLLREQAGTDFTGRNVEAVLKVSVIDGKTGAPSIQAVHVW
ncbi:MAG: hypothetical protein M3O31_01560 [Acidobacteriota bacterium]|nr:hypothetical protein [Acidobacteriota bacterium]